MEFKLYDVWQSFLAYLVYFFDSRSAKVEDPLLSLLRLELENARIREKQLLEIIANFNSKPVETPDSEPQEFKPVGREPWWAIARRKTAESIKRREELEKEWEASKNNASTPVNKEATQSVESLEAELGIGAENA